jgi:glycosyltransferase involved in cell wall biosynthesis
MIYYWSPDYRTPVGGVKILYRHVDILNRHGYEASVLHRHRGFRCTWFENTTCISYIRKTKLREDDYLVIPENYGSLYVNPSYRPKATKVFNRLFATPAKKVIFNQNTYNTFADYPGFPDDLRTIYKDENVAAAMVVSENNREYLSFAFPDLRIFRIHNAINRDLFSFREDKKRQICFMPRKNPEHAIQVISLLKHGGDLDGFAIVSIEGKTEKETARIMQESLIFLSFGYPEGFSLPPAEAMSCGCIVIGYHGMGGREYFNPNYCFPVEMGDILEFAKQVRKVLEMINQRPETIQRMARKAAAFINECYSEERERNDVIECWTEIMHGVQSSKSSAEGQTSAVT